MNFTSIEFLLFFPLVCLLYWKLPHSYRKWLLLLASYGFYMSFRPLAALLLFAITAVTYVAAKKVGEARASYLISQKEADLRRQKRWRNVGVLIPLLALALFKNEHIALVAGISFYTFQSLSYVLDVSKGSIQPENTFSDYALYISYFPQLVAGPIEKPDHLLPQLKAKQVFQLDLFPEASRYLLRGYLKKIAVADVCAMYADPIFQAAARGEGLGGWSVLAGAILFAIQIYADFSGYSDIARGCALCFGIRLMENFKFPYLVGSFGEFWDCWHISLTKWLTEYVYIPLGGSKSGKMKTYRNIMIVFLLSGIWHGFAIHFVIWGLLHGAFLCMERYAKDKWKKNIFPGPCVFLMILLTWIFFRAENTMTALHMVRGFLGGWGMEGFKAMLSLSGLKLLDLVQILLSLVVLSSLEEMKHEDAKNNQDPLTAKSNPGSVTAKSNQDPLTVKSNTDREVTKHREDIVDKKHNWNLSLTFVLLIVFAWLLLLSHNQSNVFIYFQF